MKAPGAALLVAAILLGAAPAAGVPAKRPTPDYDGRGGGPSAPSDMLLWPPRVALFPLFLASEYIVRRPLGALITYAERSNLPKAVYDVFAFGPDHKSGFAPIGFVDFGFRASGGLYLFWDDAFIKGNDLRLRGTIGGADWLAASFTERVALAPGQTVMLNVSGVRRPDRAFFGLGPRSLQAQRSRYASETFDAHGEGRFVVGPAVQIETRVGLRDATFANGHLGDDPSIGQAASGGYYALPEGIGRGYTAAYNRVAAAVDTRLVRAGRRSGIRVEADAEQGSDLRVTPSSGWLRYGATVGGFAEVHGPGRVVSISTSMLFADPLGSRPVPFDQLVSLGGSGPMRGFFPGRLLGRSAAVAALRYRWPIWAFLDGSVQAAVGNVFDERLKGLKPSLLRFSGAIGIESVGSPDSSLEILFGLGSETFEQGGRLDSLRLVVGTNHGF